MEFNGKTEAEALTSAFAASLDKADALSDFRDEFIFPPAPKESGRDRAIYLCGNSLGLQPKGLAAQVTTQLTKWGEEGVEGHFTEPTPWLTIDDIVQNSLSKLVGALPTEVVAMNSLTVNLHMLMCSFYCPDVKPNTTSSSGSKSSPAGRHIIITEKKAFPSDTHAVTSQIQHWVRFNQFNCFYSLSFNMQTPPPSFSKFSTQTQNPLSALIPI
jgi:kynureninase